MFINTKTLFTTLSPYQYYGHILDDCHIRCPETFTCFVLAIDHMDSTQAVGHMQEDSYWPFVTIGQLWSTSPLTVHTVGGSDSVFQWDSCNTIR